MIHSTEEAIARIEAIPELQNKLAYDHFTESQELPFAAYTYKFRTGGADDYKGVQWIDFTLEVYSNPRDISLERKIISALADVEIDSDSTYIDDERMYMTYFRFIFPYKLTTTIS